MSEAKRVEELMQHAEVVDFDVDDAVSSTVLGYRDAYPERQFDYQHSGNKPALAGAPELLIQMLDKLVDNAVSFSQQNDVITIRLAAEGSGVVLSVENPGPPLPDTLKNKLFDSLVSVRGSGDDRHLGLGLYIARAHCRRPRRHDQRREYRRRACGSTCDCRSIRQLCQKEVAHVLAHDAPDLVLTEARGEHFPGQYRELARVDPDGRGAVVIRTQRNVFDTEQVDGIANGPDDAGWRDVTNRGVPVTNADESSARSNVEHELIVEVPRRVAGAL
jgi:hypothetical protein